jgi:hypothetical protein
MLAIVGIVGLQASVQQNTTALSGMCLSAYYRGVKQ